MKQHEKLVECVTLWKEQPHTHTHKAHQDQHILLKVQDTDLAAREAICQKDYTREDDRHQETIKDTKTIEEQASNKTTYFQYIVQYVKGSII